MRRTNQPVLLPAEPEEFPDYRLGFWRLDRSDLDRIVQVLNEKQKGQDGQDEPTPDALALIRLMDQLKNCDGNLQKMMNGEGLLRHNVETACFGRWVPSKTGRALAHLKLIPSPQTLVDWSPPEVFAAMLFQVWTLNPEWNKLAGPCARCGNYYIKKRASQKVYCSRRCGNITTAVARTRERLATAHAGKLRRAQIAMQKWTTARTKHNWKVFVSKRQSDITPKFLTRAVNKGELVPPKQEK